MRRAPSGQLELRFEHQARHAPAGVTFGGRSPVGRLTPAAFDLAAWIATQPARACEPGLYARRRLEVLRRLAMPRSLIEQALRVRTVAEAWSLWIGHCRGAGLARGCWLVELFPSGYPMTPMDAEQMLVTAEREGQIRRGAYEPSLEFEFFGLGGRMGPASGNAPRYAVEWSWVPGGVAQ